MIILNINTSKTLPKITLTIIILPKYDFFLHRLPKVKYKVIRSCEAKKATLGLKHEVTLNIKI